MIHIYRAPNIYFSLNNEKKDGETKSIFINELTDSIYIWKCAYQDHLVQNWLDQKKSEFLLVYKPKLHQKIFQLIPFYKDIINQSVQNRDLFMHSEMSYSNVESPSQYLAPNNLPLTVPHLKLMKKRKKDFTHLIQIVAM